MKIALAAACGLAVALAAQPSIAKDDDLSTHDWANVLNNPEFASKLAGVKFVFGAASPGQKVISAGIKTSTRTNRVGKSGEVACQRAAASALINFHNEATSAGGNAVVKIVSNWKNNEWSSTTQYQCAVGGVMAGVAIKGDVAKVK
jgi:uncharacterized protein YbjQ (UPF0145 family)